MKEYQCSKCLLAFKLGGFIHRHLAGSTDHLACTACGTMHLFIFHRAKGDRDFCDGTAELKALAGPIRDLKVVLHDWGDGTQLKVYEWPYAEKDWIEIAKFNNKPHLNDLTCQHCQIFGKLVQAMDDSASQESHCPVCDGPLECLSYYLIH